MKNEYYFNKIVIGGSLESLLYSFINEIPILIKEPIVPFELEKVYDIDNYSFLGYSGIREIYKSELWDRLTFLLSMNGMILMPNMIKNIRNENKCFSISTVDNSRIKVKYKQKIDFDKVLKSTVDVYDWFDVRSGSMHSFSHVQDKKSKFVRKLFFYPSKRFGATKLMKDVVAFSKIETDRLLDYENSESYARLKTLKMMKDQGLRGRPNGYNKKGIRLHYAINIEHSHRQIIKNYKPLYSLEDLLTQNKKQGRLWKSTKKLFRHKQISTSRELYQLPDYL